MKSSEEEQLPTWGAPSRLRLSPVELAPKAVAQVENGLLEMTFSRGRKCRVDLKRFPRPGIARDVLLTLRDGHERGVGFGSPGRVLVVVSNLNRFGEFLLKADPEGAIDRFADFDEDTLASFADWLLGRSEGNGDQGDQGDRGDSLAIFQNVRLLLEQAAGLGLIDPRVPEAAIVTMKLLPPRNFNPREPYSAFISENLAEACRCDVKRILDRLGEGSRWAEAGQSSDAPDWTDPNAASWQLHHNGLPSLELYNRLRNRAYRRELSTPSWQQILRGTYLSGRDFVPFAILIALDTGLPIESVRELDADCLVDPSLPRTELLYIKRRRGAGDKRWRLPVEVKKPFSAGWVIVALLEATKVARRQANLGHDANSLFVGRYGVTLRRSPVDVQATYDFLKHNPLARDSRGGLLENIELCRLRKTKVAQHYVEVAGDIKQAVSGHLPRTFVKHYAILQAMTVRHEEALAEGLTNALTAATQTRVPKRDVTVSERLPTRSYSPAAEPEHAWISGCLDPLNSPYTAPGTMCGAPLWGCLDCANAVFTEPKIPGLLRLLDELTTRRHQVSQDAWRAIYAVPYVRVIQILDSFDQAMLRAAIAETEIGTDWLPPFAFPRTV